MREKKGEREWNGKWDGNTEGFVSLLQPKNFPINIKLVERVSAKLFEGY